MMVENSSDLGNITSGTWTGTIVSGSVVQIVYIARTAHSVNKAMCEFNGDTSQPTWADAPQWQRDSIILGVNYIINNPDSTPASQHQLWLDTKAAEGWKYGPVKNVELKEHPAFLPYDELPPEQKIKDTLFRAVVKSLI